MYRQRSLPNGAPDPDFIVRVEDGAVVPRDPDNRDWQSYLAWLGAGNLPLAA